MFDELPDDERDVIRDLAAEMGATFLDHACPSVQYLDEGVSLADTLSALAQTARDAPVREVRVRRVEKEAI
ncbi:hypothetical protein [Tsukamurella paurometabola]|uniref:Uncharacterized protein n=1 Tax=Tsukamurella paurometabola TaxID=2061 RepID=A0ABS5NDR3_TSUPA|nr:hypothetical protein [Tsukamurella paurometabola]MBS4102405.1 hypothetical protein [Tsukamurella paurometabola]